MIKENQIQTGYVHSITSNAPYQSDPLCVYQTLCQGSKNNLLLESAEIDKKHLLKSLLLVDAAVKIVCHGNIVTFNALSQNGKNALKFAQQQLAKHAQLHLLKLDHNADQLIVTFSAIPADLDENSRLKAINPFQSLRLFNQLKNVNQHPFSVFLGGVFAFDMMSMSEQLPNVPDGENTCPDFVYYLAETIVVIDHEKQHSEIIGNVFSFTDNSSSQQNTEAKQDIQQRIHQIKSQLQQNSVVETSSSNNTTNNIETNISKTSVAEINAPEISVDISDEKYCQIVEQLKENIRAGDIFQVVPSRTFSLPCADTIAAYQALKLSNPSPYMFYLNDSDFCIFGASPESAIKYQQHTSSGERQVEIYPIAGTRPRGFTADGKFSPDLDSRIELDLRLDKKELAEHIMLVDLARNDIARVCKAGTRHVADLLKVDRYSHVMHLVSRVCGTLSDDLDALHAYQACMNMGTLSGAPKVKATELIRFVEGKRRGSYGGAVGYITGTGEMDTCIVIRSAFVKDGIAQVQAGAGVVFDSDPQAETNETRQKAQAVLSAIQASAIQASTITSAKQIAEQK
ncbi:MAG: anthranilate synthase component I [Gammaproteobacteria bacterium]|nr:MAG: anthranilate synthase component I [Gammaproteobacteria bacterium]